MHDKLTIQERIRDLRQEKKLTLEQLSEQTGLSKSALGSYESNDTKDISHYAIIRLAKFYGVTTDYLLGISEQKTVGGTSMYPDSDFTPKQGLLPPEKVNRRLLQELVSHEEFPRLLADIEIYIDNIAGMQIQNLNAWIDVVRQELIAKHNPDKDDPTLRVLYIDNSISYRARKFNNELWNHGKDFAQFCEPFERLLKGHSNDDTEAAT